MTAGTTAYDHLLSIQHGTLDLEEAPSRQLFYYEMAPVISNHVVVMADYLGFGVSQTADRQHPYLHNESTGRTCADMIEAALMTWQIPFPFLLLQGWMVIRVWGIFLASFGA